MGIVDALFLLTTPGWCPVIGLSDLFDPNKVEGISRYWDALVLM